MMQPQSLPLALQENYDDPLHPRNVLRAVRRHWLSIIGLCLITALLALLWGLSRQPVYEATTTIVIESREANMVSIEEVYGMPSGNKEDFLTQLEILQSRDIAQVTVEKLGLMQTPAATAQPDEEGASDGKLSQWFAQVLALLREPEEPVDADELLRNRAVGGFMYNLTVEPVPNTRLIRISYRSGDRRLAARAANTVADVYIQDQMDANLRSTREAEAWLSTRLEDLRADLMRSQSALQAFRDQEDLVDVAGVDTLATRELNEVTTRLGEARRLRVEAENIYQELGGDTPYSAGQLMRMPAVVQHPMVQSLAQAEADAQQEVANLAKRYGPEHPRMINAKIRYQNTREELREQVEQVTQEIRTEYRLALRNEQILEQQLGEARSDVADLNRKGFQLNELEKEVENDQRLYDMFFTRARETSETIGFQPPPARIVEKATPPIKPVSPNVRRIVLLAALLSLIVGALLAVLRQLLDNTVKAPDEVSERLQLPLLGVLPALKKRDDSNPGLAFVENHSPVFSEAIRTLRTSLVLSRLENPYKVIVLTSTAPGEGKSTVAINLAAAMAKMERVVLVGADLRRPSLASAFGIKGKKPGVTGLLADGLAIEEAVESTDAGFDILPAGQVPDNPLEIVSSSAFKSMIDDLSERYDRVLVDSAPMNAVSDALMLGTLADTIVYIVEAESTPYNLLQKSVRKIRQSNLPLAGVVVNRLDLRKQSAYGAGDYYSSYYGEAPDTAS